MRSVVFLLVASTFLSCFCHVASKDCFLQPIQVIFPNADHSVVHINSTALNQIVSCISGPISILGVVGPYHSGKSFLLNILANRSDAFKIGPSTNPQTMGLWMLPTNFRSPLDNSTVILMDTEGFFGNDVAEAYDATTFAIATLISSHLVYNSIKLIDQAAVEYLELLARRTQLFNLRSQVALELRSSGNSSSSSASVPILPEEFPALTWVVEDFVQDLGGRTALQWLEEFLSSKRDAAQLSGMQQIFSSIDCETLFLPATSLADLRDLSAVPRERLTPEFTVGVDRLRSKLFASLKARQTGSEKMTAAQLSSILKFLVQSANTQSFPRIPSLWNAWLANLTEHAKSDALALLDIEISRKITDNFLPLTGQQFDSTSSSILVTIRDYFQKLLFGLEHLYNDPVTTSQLNANIDRTLSQAKERNELRVVRFITTHSEKARVSSNTRISAIPLPQDTAQLTVECEKVGSASLSQFVEDVKGFNYATAYAQLSEYITATCKALAGENRIKINELLTKLDEAARRDYQQLLNSVKRKPLEKSAFDERHAKWSQQVLNNLQKTLEDNRQTWLTKDQQYAGALSLLKDHLRDQLSIGQEANHRLIVEALLPKFNNMTDILSRLSSILKPFPNSPSAITKQANAVKSECLSALEKGYSAFGYPELTRAQLEIAQQRGAELIAKLLAQNQERYDELYGAALKTCSTGKRRERVSQCTVFCWSSLIPGLEYNLFQQDIHTCLEEKKMQASELSQEILDELIPLWYQDLNLGFNFAPLLLAALVLGITSRLLK